VEGERSLPCGKCEKCRRIVGMLLAYGADPSRCGYSQKQIDACLESLAAHGVHQEAAGARHLAWMLQQRGLLPEDAPAFRNARPVPEVMKLRFHREASPVEGLPQDLRTPIFRLLMHHADGAVERTGRLWTPCEPLEPSLQALPYRPRPQPPAAPATADGGRGQTTSGATPRPYLLAELTWPRAKERFAECDTALLPVGAIEQHGYHLPLDTDSWDADYLCRRVAEACGDPKPLVLPLIPYGVSYHHDDFPGTLSINPETLAALVYDVGMAAARNGIRKLIIVNGHGGNAPTLQFAAQKINRDAHIFTCVDTGETSDADIYRITDTPNDVHAGEVETSTALATRPHLVDMDRATRDVQDFSSQYLDFSSENSVEWYAHTSRISTSGVMGDATAASVEKGERMWSIMVDHLVAFVESLKAVTLDQLHERRM
jgi:creatinine amidohydrolase/Fe(II)-dependent formamide hydrolase-like protein